jgi:hypothetical protein
LIWNIVNEKALATVGCRAENEQITS